MIKVMFSTESTNSKLLFSQSFHGYIKCKRNE